MNYVSICEWLFWLSSLCYQLFAKCFWSWLIDSLIYWRDICWFFYKQCVLTFRCILRQLGCCLIHLYPTTKVSYMLHSSRKHGIQVNVSWKIIYFLFNSFYLCLISILSIFWHKTLILRNINSNKNMYMISYFLYLQLLK